MSGEPQEKFDGQSEAMLLRVEVLKSTGTAFLMDEKISLSDDAHRRLEEALPLLKLAISADPANVFGHKCLGMAHY
ncbi:MAG TPA: hypothetical protein VIG74_03455, partial [Alphaproteobacteria bacterium]